MDTIKLFFELENDAFIDGIEVKELKGLHDNDDIKFDNVNDLQWSVEPRDDDQRSDEVESQVAIDTKMTDIWKEKCEPGRCALGAMPQCIPDWEYETQSSNIPPAMAESTQDGLIDMMDLLITNWTNRESM